MIIIYYEDKVYKAGLMVSVIVHNDTQRRIEVELY